MDDVLIILIIASLATYGIGIVGEKKRGLGWLSLILSACALLGIISDMGALGDMFLVSFLPMLFVMLMSIVELIKVVND